MVQVCKIYLYADDTALYYSAKGHTEIARVLNEEILGVSEWFKANKLTLNIAKTKFMIFGTPNKTKSLDQIKIKIDDKEINQVNVFK